MKNIDNIKAKGNRIMVMLLMLVALLGASSCKKDVRGELKGGEQKPLAITLSKNTVVLEETAFANDAVEFTWTAGTNLGTNSSIGYKLLFDKKGNGFKNAAIVDMGKATFAKKYSVKDFNTLLLDELHLTPGVETALDVRLVATISGSKKGDSTNTAITVTPYQPVTTTLYLIGDATPNGWDAGNATPLILSSTTPGLYTWQGRLSSGEFKFITTLGQFSPSYNKGATDKALLLHTLDSQPDEKFKIATGNLYMITVNLLNLSINIVEGDEPPYTALWIVGDATPNGWNIDAPNTMRLDRSNPFVFTYSGLLKAGDFKIPTATGDWGTDFYMPLVNYPEITATGVQLV
ncbi:MAG: SusF/SusE family outer membrane protein, partial [Sphingobacteriales bacterium]